MATVTITLADTEEEGGVSLKVAFDPPIKGNEEFLTHAQAEAALLIEIMQRRASGHSLAEIAEDIDESDYGDVVEGTMTSSVDYVEDEGDLS